MVKLIPTDHVQKPIAVGLVFWFLAAPLAFSITFSLWEIKEFYYLYLSCVLEHSSLVNKIVLYIKRRGRRREDYLKSEFVLMEKSLSFHQFVEFLGKAWTPYWNQQEHHSIWSKSYRNIFKLKKKCIKIFKIGWSYPPNWVGGSRGSS